MELPQAYERVTGIFELWSRLMERRLRERAAARWDGRGTVAVGYYVVDKRLVVNDREAVVVRELLSPL